MIGVDELEHVLDHQIRKAVDHRPRHPKRIGEQRIVDRDDAPQPLEVVLAR